LRSASGHRTLAEKAFDHLHQAIIQGEIPPGERLPIEDLAGTLEMSPMPIREALRRLDAGGLVEHVPHRGARVRELSIDDLREVYEARLALEPLAVAHAAEHFTEEDAARASDALRRHVAAYRKGTPIETFAAHTEFHFALYDAANSRWLKRLITPLWESSERYRIALPARYRRALEERRVEHERILLACVQHDPETAARELYDHLVETANRVSHRMGSDEDLFAPTGTKGRAKALGITGVPQRTTRSRRPQSAQAPQPAATAGAEIDVEGQHRAH
jgi:DNA-binding GntR family transcriptional regulator